MAIDAQKSDKQTLIEEGTRLEGTLESNCPVVVKGTVDGRLTAPDLVVASSGSVEGAIKATRIRSEGKLSGRVDAGSVFLSGSVGNSTVINAEQLEVKLGSGGSPLQVTFGNCNLAVGDDPAAALGKSSSPNGPSSKSTGGVRAGSPNAGSPNAGSPNAGSPNAGSPNAGSPNAGSPNEAKRGSSPDASSDAKPEKSSPTSAAT